VFAVDRAGLVGEDGETHHGVFDVGFLRQIPGMQILCPASQEELRAMLRHAVWELSGPVAVRYPKGVDGLYTAGIWSNRIFNDAQITIVTYGYTINLVLEAADLLLQNGISADVIKLDQIQPLNLQPVLDSVRNTGRILVVEEVAKAGSIGEALFCDLLSVGERPICRTMNYGTGIVTHGDMGSLRKMMGMDSGSIYDTAKELLSYEEERTS